MKNVFSKLNKRDLYNSEFLRLHILKTDMAGRNRKIILFYQRLQAKVFLIPCHIRQDRAADGAWATETSLRREIPEYIGIDWTHISCIAAVRTVKYRAF